MEPHRHTWTRCQTLRSRETVVTMKTRQESVDNKLSRETVCAVSWRQSWRRWLLKPWYNIRNVQSATRKGTSSREVVFWENLATELASAGRKSAGPTGPKRTSLCRRRPCSPLDQAVVEVVRPSVSTQVHRACRAGTTRTRTQAIRTCRVAKRRSIRSVSRSSSETTHTQAVYDTWRASLTYLSAQCRTHGPRAIEYSCHRLVVTGACSFHVLVCLEIHATAPTGTNTCLPSVLVSHPASSDSFCSCSCSSWFKYRG